MKSDDAYRGGVHFVSGCLMATMGLYNVGEAVSDRRRWRHVVNAVIYLGATIWEGTNTLEHWKRA